MGRLELRGALVQRGDAQSVNSLVHDGDEVYVEVEELRWEQTSVEQRTIDRIPGCTMRDYILMLEILVSAYWIACGWMRGVLMAHRAPPAWVNVRGGPWSFAASPPNWQPAAVNVLNWVVDVILTDDQRGQALRGFSAQGGAELSDINAQHRPVNVSCWQQWELLNARDTGRHFGVGSPEHLFIRAHWNRHFD